MHAALKALVARRRRAEIDAAYEAYDRHPLDEPDEWGDLASFHAANDRQKAETSARLRRGQESGCD